MSEICFECFNKMCGGKEKYRRYVISRDLDLCEECGEYKKVVVCERRYSRYMRHMADIAAALKMLKEQKRKNQKK